MADLLNSPESFRDDMLAGLAAAYERYLVQIPDTPAVMRKDGPNPGKVAVIIGGGSGHYPAFAGFVGPGLADAAVIGDIFTSPSAEYAYRAIRAMDSGAGVLLSYGRYSGDIMNFGLAQKRARDEGLDVRTVLVTDDIASASLENWDKRRGIAGDFCVFKIAGAAAERGDSLDEVERLANKANASTRTLGVAFGGCTLPGAQDPLFTVAPNRMEVGLGVHGEPGVRTAEKVSAAELARDLVRELMADSAQVRQAMATDTVAVLMNGLGRTKYEELFVLYREAAQLLQAEGLRIVMPEVGELVTSLDMAGCSITLLWLDPELTELWSAPADSPGYRRVGTFARSTGSPAKVRSVGGGPKAGDQEPTHAAKAEPSLPLSAEEARCADVTQRALQAMLDRLVAAEEDLGRLDAVAGDGDHGRGMVRGIRAAVAATQTSSGTASRLLQVAGQAWGQSAGGASGVLWGQMLIALGESLKGPVITAKTVAGGLQQAKEAVVEFGGAQVGDKTMMDALAPFVTSFAERVEAGETILSAWTAALVSAQEGVERTKTMVSRRGRSAVLGERSLGTPDPGAVSLVHCLTAVADILRAPTP